MRKIALSITLAFLGMSMKSSAIPALSQNFESGIAPWTNVVTGGGGGWAIASTAVNTPLGTIPSHTNYAIVNEAVSTGSSYNNPAVLTSPTFSLVGMTAPYLSYDSYYFEAYLTSSLIHERGWVQISTNGGTSWTTIDSIKYNGYPATSFDVNWVTKFVSLSSVTATANCKLQFVYQDNGGHIIGAAIDNVLIYDASSTDLGLSAVSPTAGSASDYFLVGSGATFSGTVRNYNSTTAVSSFTAYYQVGASAPVSSVISVSVPPLGTAPFSITPAFTVALTSQVPVKVWVTETGDLNHANDTLNTAVIGVSFMPHKRMLFEEATGLWCGWCVRGIVFMDSLNRAYGTDVNIVSVHNGDPMASDNTSATKYDAMMGTYISGYPSMLIDRRYVDDPSGCFTDYSNDHLMFGFADMTLIETASGGNINASVTVKPATDLSGDYRLELVVTEDGVFNASYLQHNYYAVGGSGHSTPMHTVGLDFNNLPTDIPNINFPFVARTTLPADLSTLPARNGIAASLPATMTAGTTYPYTFAAIPIASNWVASKLSVIALLIDNNPTSATYGNVLNSISGPGTALGVENKKAGISNMTVYPNPTADDAHVRFILDKNTLVHFAVYDVAGRAVFTAPTEQMNAGAHQINFSTNDFASGIYNLVVTTDNGTTTSRLSVEK